MVWTVNRPDRLAAYLDDPRVAGIITDVPALAAATRDAVTDARGGPAAAVTARMDHPFPNRVRPEHGE